MASILSVEQLRGLSSGDNPNTITLPTGQTFYAPGHVLQVVQTVKTDTFNMNSATFADVTGFSATITPTSTSSKILVLVDTQVSGSVTYNVKLALVRGSSTYLHTKVQRIAQDGQGQYREYSLGYCYLDSPSTTSATTYKLQMNVNGQPAYLNRPADQGGYTPAGSESNSTITLMEIAG